MWNLLIKTMPTCIRNHGINVTKREGKTQNTQEEDQDAEAMKNK
jgi:hypothetical protein